MKFTIAAFALSAALGTIGSYAAELPETTIDTAITLNDMSVDVSTGSLKVLDVNMFVTVVEENLKYFCTTENRELPQFPDTLDCKKSSGGETSGTVRFSVHAPVPQISESTDKTQLAQAGYTPEWTQPVIMYIEWDSGKSRTFGSYVFPEGKFETLYTDPGIVTLDAGITSVSPLQFEVITQPN